MSLIISICFCLEVWKEYRFYKYKQRTHDAVGMFYLPVFKARDHIALKKYPWREQRKPLLLDHLKIIYKSSELFVQTLEVLICLTFKSWWEQVYIRMGTDLHYM
jgi:hypothetical protein